MAVEIMSEAMLRAAGVYNNDDRAKLNSQRNAVERLRPLIVKHNTPTPKMVHYVEVLLDRLREHDPALHTRSVTWWDRNRNNLTRDQVSDVINRLKARLEQPVSPRPAPDTAARRRWTKDDIPLGVKDIGRFALVWDDNTGNKIRFYHVKVSKRTGFLYVMARHGDSLTFVPFDQGAGKILALIAQDPQAAMLLYGREIGSCGHCGRTLTKDQSRERGIGPVCARGMGW